MALVTFCFRDGSVRLLARLMLVKVVATRPDPHGPPCFLIADAGRVVRGGAIDGQGFFDQGPPR